MTSAIDPTRVVMSAETMDVLLSEFVGNNSCYTHGMANPVQSDEWGGERRTIVRINGWALAELIDRLRANTHYLERLIGNPNLMRHFTISYGFIHPRLSEKIVKWKPGHEPSLHRWDDGAAADILFHAPLYTPYFTGIWDGTPQRQHAAPVHWAAMWFENPEIGPHFERLITYSESPYICIGTRGDTTPARKWHENRFRGERGSKPDYIRHRNVTMGTEARQLQLAHDWRGGGYPSYHGGGKRQHHHIRTSGLTMASTWLYNRDRVHYGRANRIPQQRIRRDRVLKMMECAGIAYDIIAGNWPGHLPVIGGIEFGKGTSNWEESGYWSFTITNHLSNGDLLEHVQHTNDDYPQMQIESIESYPLRSYVSPVTGRPLGDTNTQQRVRVIGRMYEHGIDFESATRSPNFREREGGSSRQRRTRAQRVPESDEGTPRGVRGQATRVRRGSSRI